MPYIAKYYSLNKTYFIEEHAIATLIEKIVMQTPTIKMHKYTIKIFPKKNIFIIMMSISIKNLEESTQILQNFTKSIDSKCNSLFSIKPTNILVDIKGIT